MDSLQERLSAALPIGIDLSAYHVSSLAQKCNPIFPPSPGRKPRKTNCVKHLLAVSTNGASGSEEGGNLIFAIEVLVYMTTRLTTIFVSKADSTGYLNVLQLPSGTRSPLRTISSTFIRYLVDTYQRNGVRLMVSLFARAQDQYIFPGSVDNGHKHVLDDRQLIQWWCNALDLVIQSGRAWTLVPGMDANRVKALLPAPAPRWNHGHPLLALSKQSAKLPPRCLIPRFPDDPKARFMEELDSEGKDTGKSTRKRHVETSKGSDAPSESEWRSVRTIQQFWDAMEFRQECSSGRAVGFIWIIFSRGDTANDMVRKGWPGTRLAKIGLTGPIRPLADLHADKTGRNVLRESTYNRVLNLLLRLDFSNDNNSAASTARWTKELRSVLRPKGSNTMDSKMQIKGQSKDHEGSSNKGERGKRKADEPKSDVNVLATNVVRKKQKT